MAITLCQGKSDAASSFWRAVHERMANGKQLFPPPLSLAAEEANVVFWRVIACSACVEYCDGSLMRRAQLGEVFPSEPLRVLVLHPPASRGSTPNLQHLVSSYTKTPSSTVFYCPAVRLPHRTPECPHSALSRKAEPRATGAFSFPDARYPVSRFFDAAATTTSVFRPCAHIPAEFPHDTDTHRD